MNPKIIHFAALASMLCAASIAHGATYYVDQNAHGRNNGSTWSDAFVALSEAINAASVGDQIWVAKGTYGSITLKDGVALLGGFSGSESSASARDSNAHLTYLSGGGTSRVVTATEVGASAELRGFHIVEGFVDLPDIGAGLYVEQSDVMIVDCVFHDNRSVAFGGAVAIRGGAPTFINCQFLNNDGGWGAGAVFVRKSRATSFVNCLFHGNTAREAGALAIVTGSVRLSNCTLAGNTSRLGKGGAIFDARGEAVLENCILWDNVSPLAATNEIYNKPAANRKTTIEYSNVKGGWEGTGNINADPLFVNATIGDYRLQAGSPCRDHGSNAALPGDFADLSGNGNRSETLPRDLALRGRIQGTTVDMGAFEYDPPGE